MIAAAHSLGVVAVQILIPAVVCSAMIWANRGQNRIRRQRAVDLQALAERLTFDDFRPGKDNEFALGWGFLSRLAHGDDRYAFNVLRGTYHGQALFVFDYHFQIREGKNTHEHFGTILMLVFNEAFPQLTIGPENLGLKIAEALGVANVIRFESAEFSRKFCVRSPDKKFAYDVCSPRMMEYLMVNRDLNVEIQGPVISIGFEPQLPVEKIDFNLQRLAEIRSLMPQYLFTIA